MYLSFERRSILAVVLIAAATAGCYSAADKQGPSASEWCSIEKPPANAGEIGAEGVRVKVFPRSIDMPTDYSGCQTLWDYDKRDGDSPQKVFENRYVSGVVVESTVFPLSGAPPGSEVYTCHYVARHLIDGSEHCPSFAQANAREESLPAGCLSKIESSALGSHEPCLQEWK
jgi:hypothetical protein